MRVRRFFWRTDYKFPVLVLSADGHWGCLLKKSLMFDSEDVARKYYNGVAVKPEKYCGVKIVPAFLVESGVIRIVYCEGTDMPAYHSTSGKAIHTMTLMNNILY